MARLSKKDRELQRRIAIRCFNQAWELLEKKRKKEEDRADLLHLAHSSRYLWGAVGGPWNRAVADWLLSRAYAELDQPQLSLEFAESCLAECREHGLSDVEHTAYEAIGRAYATAKDYGMARKFLGLAQDKLDALKLGKEGRMVYQGQIDDTRRLLKDL